MILNILCENVFKLNIKKYEIFAVFFFISFLDYMS